MKVVVTGGSGLAGRHVVADLAGHGYRVTNADRVAADPATVPYRLADLEDLGAVYGCLAGAEAVVHMAAIPRPGRETNEAVFRTNVLSTYHVLEAAATLGIRRVVLASSISVLGFPFFYRPLAPRYVPVDEEHPVLAQDPYALSKVLGEELAAGFARRAEMTTVSLRFAWIQTPATFLQQIQPLQDDPAAGAANLWSYVDARDVAQACRLALEADLQGHGAFFIAAPDSFMTAPTAELVRRYYPATVCTEAARTGSPSLISSAKAAGVLGYRAEHVWASY
jgi:nucleoside-diphosphate-sugar epimerase